MNNEQMPALRAIHNMTHPKGLVTHPRPASGIAHMGKMRSPIALADGGSVDGGGDSSGGGFNWGDAALAGAGGLFGGLASQQTTKGFPKDITLQQTNNPFAVPLISRSIDPVTQAITTHILGYQSWPGSNAPSSKTGGIFAGYAPGSSYQTDGYLVSPDIKAPSAMVTPDNPASQTVSLLPVAAGSGGPAPVTSGFLASSGHGVSSGSVGHKARGGIVGLADGGLPPQAMPPQGQGMPPQAMPQQTDPAADQGTGQDKAIFLAAVQALQGQSPNPKAALLMFVQRYGIEALQELQQHLQGTPSAQGIQQTQGAPATQPATPQGQQMPSPGAMSSGGAVSGPGDGMSDSIPAQVAQTGQPVNLSKDEFVIPADAVAMLGNGSSRAGAAKLHAGIAKLRKQKYGHTKQPPALAPGHNPILG